jgi:cytochrome c biogenesis factor
MNASIKVPAQTLKGTTNVQRNNTFMSIHVSITFRHLCLHAVCACLLAKTLTKNITDQNVAMKSPDNRPLGLRAETKWSLTLSQIGSRVRITVTLPL